MAKQTGPGLRARPTSAITEHGSRARHKVEVGLPEDTGTINFPGFNYKELPTDDPRRIEVERAIVEAARKHDMKRGIASVYADKMSQKRRRNAQ